MDKQQKQLLEHLREAGAVLERKKKHVVWRLPDGRIFVHAATPSDSHAWSNALREFKLLVGLNEPDRGLVGPRREHKVPRKPQKVAIPTVLGTVRARSLAEQLASVKVWSQDSRVFSAPELPAQSIWWTNRPDPLAYEAVPAIPVSPAPEQPSDLRILDIPELVTEAKCPPQLIPTSLPRLQGPASAPRSPFLRRLLDWLW